MEGIKIEWAKDYFGPDVVMAKQNDNVAQLRYYFRHLKEIIAWAKDWSSNTCVIIDPPPYDGVTGVDETVHLLERYNAVWRQANRQDEPLTTNQTLSHKYRYLSEFR